MSTAVVLFRRDLRLADNPALFEAARAYKRVLALYVHAPEEEGEWAPGAASRWWLHHSLEALDASLARHGGSLQILRGCRAAPGRRLESALSLETVRRAIAASGAEAVYFNRLYEPKAVRRDKALRAALEADGVAVRSFNAALWREPWEVLNRQGEPYRVFTPFWRTLRAGIGDTEPLPEPGNLSLWEPLQRRAPGGSGEGSGEYPSPLKLLPWGASGAGVPATEGWEAALAVNPDGAATATVFAAEAGWLSVGDLGLLPTRDWARGFAEWTPGERGAQEMLALFADDALGHYAEGRDLPARHGTSRLSPHLHFGEISPVQIAAGLRERVEAIAKGSPTPPASRRNAADIEPYLRQLGWREFAHHLLYHFPKTPKQNFNPTFDAFRWAKRDAHALRRWKEGKTGIPIVDAGMRELWATGWMHNRVRMLVASLLTKNLRQHWVLGEKWFWDTLVDADLANNALGWQWVAGSGADAAPYFRIFNPVTQSEKFDPDGAYIRRWVPELAKAPGRLVHAPWEDEAFLKASGYPPPIVDLKRSREDALTAYRISRGDRAGAGPAPAA